MDVLLQYFMSKYTKKTFPIHFEMHKFKQTIYKHQKVITKYFKPANLSEHSERNCTVFGGIDEETGELVSVSEWIVQAKNDAEHALVQKQIASIEQEFNYLVKLKHQNLVRYFNIKHDYSPENKSTVQILREIVLGKHLASVTLLF